MQEQFGQLERLGEGWAAAGIQAQNADESEEGA